MKHRGVSSTNVATVCVVKVKVDWPIGSCIERAETENEWTQWSSGYGTHMDCERCGFESYLVPIFVITFLMLRG